MSETLPPFPGTEEKPKARQFVGLVLSGNDWVEVGYGTRHDDGKGIAFELTIGQPDGATIHIREIGREGFFRTKPVQRVKRWRAHRPR